MADLYPARLDGIELEMETLDDSFEKSIVRHEFPFRDGALLEDMGQKARTVRLRCHFWDDGGDHTTYDDHVDLLNHLQSRELFELIHPKYGLMQGCVEQISVRHDDRDMAAEVDITFVENLRGETESVDRAAVEAAAEAAFVDAHERMMDGLAEDVRDTLGGEAAGILAVALDETRGVLEQFSAVSLAARDYLRRVDTFVDTLEATLTGVANPANSLIASIGFGVRLPGRVIGALARCCERYTLLYDSLSTAPARFAANFSLAMLELENTLGINQPQVSAAAAAQGGLRMASMYGADEDARQALRRSEGLNSYDMAGNYIAAETSGQVMTAQDLEQSLAVVRTMVQRAVDLDRLQTGLKGLARQLLEHVNTVKLEREKIARVDLDNSMPLHLVCLKYGLPYNMAERIHAINRIFNPNFTAGQVSIYVR